MEYRKFPILHRMTRLIGNLTKELIFILFKMFLEYVNEILCPLNLTKEYLLPK